MSPENNKMYGEGIQLLLLIPFYIGIFLHHTRRTAVVYQKSFNKRSSLPLLVHIGAGLFEVIRYHITALQGPVVPDLCDLLACLLQSATNLNLAKTLMRGDITTRPSYQAGGLMRPLLSIVAFILQDPFLHRASVKLVNAFLYTRIIIFLSTRLGLQSMRTHSTIYAHGVFLGALTAFSESNLPAGVHLYIGMVGAITALNRRISERAIRQLHGHGGMGERCVVKALMWLGFAELETLKQTGKYPELKCSVKDLYIT